MRRLILNFSIIFITFTFLSFAKSEENVKENQLYTEINLYTGMFDFSDTKQASGLIGFQHQTDELYRNSFLGKISPITGGFLTEKNAF